MKLPYLAILDVGHGACAVLVQSDQVVVIDAGGVGSSLRDFLLQERISRIDAVLLSHADEDHIGGLLRVLDKPEFEIGAVYVNPAAGKDTKVWDDLMIVLRRYHHRGHTLVAGNVDSKLLLSCEAVRVECLGPSPVDVVAQQLPGSARGSIADTNTMSASIRIIAHGRSVALFLGDIDGQGFDALQSEVSDLASVILVFPHHGGLAGPRASKDDTVQFAKQVCAAVRPSTVVFSLGRARFENPIPEIVQAVRSDCPDVWIACTQVSKHCCSTGNTLPTNHLSPVYARGRKDGISCAGSIVVELTPEGLSVTPDRETHNRFIKNQLDSALCQRAVLTVSASARTQ